MIPFPEARRRILDAAQAAVPEPAETDIASAAGLVLAADVVSEIDVPPFPSSAMDGYAVRAADLVTLPVELPVVTVSSAGHPATQAIGPVEAARILTGAVMVDGADTVVPVERTDGGTELVRIDSAERAGANVRAAGEDVVAGDTVLEAGTVLGPAQLGVAANVGAHTVRVLPRPRVAVVATGDELVAPGAGRLAPGQIYESNGIALAAAVAAAGATCTGVHRIPDDAERFAKEILELGAADDVVLTSGGVSMGGEHDIVKAVLADQGVDFWQVAMKPAKPLAFGDVGGAILVGLPGNPVSSLVALEVFVRPLLRTLLGITPAVPPTVRLEAAEPLGRRDDSKTWFLRVRRDPDGRVRSAGGQGSHIMTALAGATHLAVMPPDVLSVPPGTTVELIPLSGAQP